MDEYFERYRYNLALAERAEKRLPDDLGWGCVIRFYAILHLMNAYLVKKENVQFEYFDGRHKLHTTYRVWRWAGHF